MSERLERLADALLADRRRANHAHGGGAWDVADVIEIVRPEVEFLEARVAILEKPQAEHVLDKLQTALPGAPNWHGWKVIAAVLRTELK